MARATGWWRATAAFSLTGTPTFTVPPGKFHLEQPIVGIAATPDGHGYWLVASDGGIFAFGDARFYGSAGTIHLKRRSSASSRAQTGGAISWWPRTVACLPLAMRRFLGSLPGKRIATSVAAVTPTNSGRGYYVVATNGRVLRIRSGHPGTLAGGSGPEPGRGRSYRRLPLASGRSGVGPSVPALCPAAPFSNMARSASTIMRTRSSKLTSGFQPRTSWPGWRRR